MFDEMNELTQRSPHAGILFLQPVAGDLGGRWEPENEAGAGAGRARDMYAYAPRSGLPHPKQCQILMVLRDGSDEASAKRLGEELDLFALSEEEHFLLLFPNPVPGGWNYNNDPERECDIDYLIRCFGVLKGSTLGVSGFNGMVFYLAGSESASAMLMTMAALRPLNVPAMMLGSFPEGYAIPAGALHVETSAFVSQNPAAAEYLRAANGVSGEESADGVATYFGSNPNVRLLVTERPMDAGMARLCWERLLAKTRRWQNDTYGCYQRRTDFTAWGFVGHVKDTSLGINGGHPQTWYEYVPPRLRGTSEPAPLLFYFHGGYCVPLYGAEQSGFHDIADREGFVVIYPEASQNNTWNAWGDNKDMAYSDFDFFLALIEHAERNVHPIDRTRIYVSGFSMGGMMSNALACAFPDIIAAAAPCNAYNEGYFSSFGALRARMAGAGNYDPGDPSGDENIPVSGTRRMADAKKAAFDYRMPVIQTSGLLDGAWPIRGTGDARLRTVRWWLSYNRIPAEPLSPESPWESGLEAHETGYECQDARFLHHRWLEGDTPLYELLLTKRCPHALDIRAPEIMWDFLKRFRRNSDGTLEYTR